MITILGGAILVLGFVLFMVLLDLVGQSRKVLDTVQQAFVTLGDPGLDDRQKETRLRGQAGRLFKLFFIIVGICMIALGVPLAIVWLMDKLGWLNLKHVIDMTLSWQFIVGASIIMIAAAWISERKKPATKSSETYSGLEKNLHHLAFSTIPAQISISSLVTRLYAKKLEGIEIENPVFITALPRAGTTLLLELCVKTGEFISHTYRDMPFVLTPLLWNKFSRIFKQSDEMRERAHGDGMMVNADSPEAFEEIIWNAWWPSRYRRDRIVPWPVASYPEFETFFRDHIRKLTALGIEKSGTPQRYISKNNLNISRIPYLQAIFPQAIILVPFRSPLQHALSLLRQHKHFTEIHKTDDFAEYYMRAIGHYDFGANLRPVDFNKWIKKNQAKSNTLNFWLAYWIQTYTYLQQTATPRTRFVSFEALCQDPKSNLEKIAKYLQLANPALLLDQAKRVSLPKSHKVDPGEIDPTLLSRAEALYDELQKISLVN